MTEGVPKGYKRTEVGVIPEEWEVVSLQQAVDFLDEKRRPIKESERQKMKGEYPYYGASGIIDYVNSYLFDEDLILMGEDGENILSRTTRLVFHISGKVWVNNHAHVLRPHSDFDIQYLVEYLESKDYREYNSGTAQPKLIKQVLQKIPVVRPPLPEQRAIAEALSDVDSLLAALDRLIAKKRAVKAAVMHDLLTGRVRLPGFEGEWETKRMGALGNCRGGDGFPLQFQGSKEGKYPFYKVSDLNSDKGMYLDQAKNWISEDIKTRIGVHTFPKNTIVFAKIGEAIFLERKKIMKVEGCLDNNLMGFTVQEFCADHKFVYYSFVFSELGKLVSASALPALSAKEILNLHIRVPSIPEQTAIAAVLSDLDEELTALERERAKWQDIKQGMMDDLLTGKVRLVQKQESGG